MIFGGENKTSVFCILEAAKKKQQVLDLCGPRGREGLMPSDLNVKRWEDHVVGRQTPPRIPQILCRGKMSIRHMAQSAEKS